MLLSVLVVGTWQGDGREQHSRPTLTTVPVAWPTCGQFRPVTNVPRSVPVLGSGEVSLGWGTAHPLAISSGVTATGTVVCITWRTWGAANSYGQGWGEVFGPKNTRPVVRIELHAFNLGHCRRGGHLAYTKLYLREPSTIAGRPGPWSPWADTGRACSPQAHLLIPG